MAEPTLYELWEQAGGGTENFDRGRWLELTRNRGAVLSPVDDDAEPQP